MVSGAPPDRMGHPRSSEPNWQVADIIEGLPPGASAEPLHSAIPYVKPFGIVTTCQTPPGTYTLTLHTIGPGTSQSAQTEITIGSPVPDSPMGTFTTTRKVEIRYGGPSSASGGISASVTFCGTVPPRHLRITVTSALSRTGTPMPLPGYSLFRAFTPGAETWISMDLSRNVQRISAAADVLDGLSGGPYIIVFGEQPYRVNMRDDEKLGQVTYRLEVVP